MSTNLNSLWDAIQRGDKREIASHIIPQTRSNPGTVLASLPQKGLTTAGIGTADAGTPYPGTCGDRYYTSASRILEDEQGLFSHANCNELGALIEQWIKDAKDNWEPR